MIYNVYSIYDSKSRVFSQPFYCINHEVAARLLAGAVGQLDNQIGKNPTDFSLHFLASFDDNNGAFNNENPIVNLGLAAIFKEQA